MRTATIQGVLNEADLPALPEVYGRLIIAAAQTGAVGAEISAIIQSDPKLAKRLLKLSNSALFNFPQPVTTIADAVCLIGAQAISELSPGVVVISMFDQVNSDLVSIKSF